MRNVSEATKKFVAGSQRYKCANKPGKNLKGLEKYKCPLWAQMDEDRGCFDECGYEVDHINEVSVSGDNSLENLQALCKNCHLVKTKKFMMKIIKKEPIKEESDDEELDDLLDAESDDNEVENSGDEDNHNEENEESENYNSSEENSDENNSEVENQDNELQCNKCGTQFSRKYELFRHEKTSKRCSANKEINKTIFLCKFCKKIFNRKDIMTRHMTSCNKESRNKRIGNNGGSNNKKSQSKRTKNTNKLDNKNINLNINFIVRDKNEYTCGAKKTHKKSVIKYGHDATSSDSDSE